MPFSAPPLVGDALYLGFEEDIGRLILQVSMEASTARGAGVDPGGSRRCAGRSPAATAQWQDAEVLEDLTGGFNYGSGTVELQCPPRSAIEPLAGKRLRWLRCRIDDKTRTGASTTYTHPPEIYSITAAPVGALLESSHSARAESEILGVSDGTPGQVFQLRNAPVLKPRTGEHLEVQDPESGDWERWELRENFVDSTPFERHYTLDVVSGEVELGPAIRETDGGWSQYGAVPPKGAVVRMSRYRYGGGRAGNVARGALDVLRSPIPGIDTVDEPRVRRRRRGRRAARARAGARVDGDPDPLPRGDRGGLRVPGRRGVAARRARGLPRAARAGGPVPLQILPARLPGRPPAAATRSSCPTRRSCARSPSTSTPGA